MDLLRAAIALSLGDCIVVTEDRDFLVVPGLKGEKWRSDADQGTA